MSTERILVIVKTYPALSEKYIETVCTAGLREDGSWVRVYPIQFRLAQAKDRFARYSWVNFSLSDEHPRKDPRPESRHLSDPKAFEEDGHLDTRNNWQERRRLVLEKGTVFTNMGQLISDAHENKRSLATFKPTKILKFGFDKDSENWDIEKIQRVYNSLAQNDLFEDNSWRDSFRPVNKLPYKFYYIFEDDQGRSCKLHILDWEISMLFLNCRKHGDEAALKMVRDKFEVDFLKTDIHFYLGTIFKWHQMKSDNPWSIIGVAPFPHKPEGPEQPLLGI